MFEAVYTSRTPDLAAPAPLQSPVMRLAMINLPSLDSPAVSKAVNSVNNTVESATSYDSLHYKAAVGQSNDNYSLRAMLRSNLSRDPSVRAGQENALDGLTDRSNGNKVIAAYREFANASSASPTLKNPNHKTSGTVAVSKEPSVTGKPAAFGRNGFSPTLLTLAQGSSATFSKNTNSKAALRGPVSMRMPIADSVQVLNAARHGGPRTMQSAPILAAAPGFSANFKPSNYGRTLSTGPR